VYREYVYITLSINLTISSCVNIGTGTGGAEQNYWRSKYTVYNGVWGKAPEAVDFSTIFVLKVTLQSIRLLLIVSYRKQ